jgi:hypothetical protein
MANAVAGFLELVTLTVSVALLVWGLTLLVYLRRHGGFELGLAHVAADPRRRSVFLWALSMSLTAFVAEGFFESVQVYTGATGDMPRSVDTALFVVGALGIFVLMGNAMRPTPLSFQEEWTLRENAQRANIAETPVLLPPDTQDAARSGPRWPIRPGR